ncbi:trypsin-like serine peptidase [Kitasatospora sp. NPDC001547]|uniref:trypsin-like serine peptidase n=1 Tax=Kitasatospora sp. NPDC001547 TaxID=3364015 RepID=UPI0036CCA74E
MMIRHGKTTAGAAAFAGALFAFTAFLGTAPAGAEGLGAAAAPRTVTAATDTAGADATAYWTPERMRQAVLDSEGGTAAAPDAAGSRSVAFESAASGATAEQRLAGTYDRRVGKLFFTRNGQARECGGVSVTPGKLKGMVETAAHCLRNSSGDALNVVFVPAYDNGSTPYGKFPMNGAALAGNYTLGSPVGDVAYVGLGVNEQGKGLAEIMGGYGVSFGDPKDPTGAFTTVYYPSGTQATCGAFASADPKYPGQGIWLMLCGGNLAQSGAPILWVDPSSHASWVVGTTRGDVTINNEVFFQGQINESHAQAAYETLAK